MSDDTKQPKIKQPQCLQLSNCKKTVTENLPSRGPNNNNHAAKGLEPTVTNDSPPLPPGPPPGDYSNDDGWQPVWDDAYGQYYFYNSLTSETTWTNPRVPDSQITISTGETSNSAKTLNGVLDTPGDEESGNDENSLRYNPTIHGDYDPSAPYAQRLESIKPQDHEYTTVAAFNRFTGKFQSSQSRQVPEAHNDENKTKRQMEFYFDVDAAANSHDGKSLKAERQTKKLTKKELKQFKEKRRQRKEEKRKAWLKD
ncbi:WW domain-containing protein [Geopyxis carbonaria]|nr:WW domain-containing protein [Geopyxis carbonaria]